MQPILIALDTAWGSRHGGINAFNTDLLKSLGIQPYRLFEVVCVLLSVDEETVAAMEQQHRLRLISLGIDGEHLLPEHAPTVLARLQANGITDFSQVIWLGHDDKTGPIALELRQQVGGKAALVHHMHHSAYQGYKKVDSLSALEKEEVQRQLFTQADVCLAVGPRLQGELEQLLSTEPTPPPVHRLIPGLAAPEDYDVRCPETPPRYFGGFAAGRLKAEDDRIKQGRLALRSFASEVKRAREEDLPRPLLDAPRFTLMGIDAAEEAHLRQDLEGWAEACLDVNLLPFSEDRGAYFRKLAGSSFAMMLSWHEGFGLTGWEAIAARVPLILGKNSGLYEFLREEYPEIGENTCLYPLTIRGHQAASPAEENHRKEDVVAAGKAIRRIAAAPEKAKKAAVRLHRRITSEGWDWQRTASDLIRALNLPQSEATQTPGEATPPPHLEQPTAPPSDLPPWLTLPSKPAWHPDWGLSPSVLLQAASATVPFDPSRQPLLDELLHWAGSSDYPIKSRTYTGPGGTGKTRLALEAARLLQQQGWQTYWPSTDKPEDWLTQWQTHWQPQRPTLLVMDYAETRSTEIMPLLQSALERLTQPAGAAPRQLRQLRLLLLARHSGGWWQELSQQPELAPLLTGPATTPPQEIPPLEHGADREAAFRSALAAFATACGKVQPSQHYQPPLETELYQRPLYIQLAALAALEGRAPASADSLLEAQLNREWQYWRRGPGQALMQQVECEVEQDVWAQALTLLALTGGSPDQEQTQERLKQLGLLSQIILPLSRALHTAYPGGGRSLAPLQPDLLAERLLHQQLASPDGAHLLSTALHHAPEPALTFLGRFCAEGDGKTLTDEETTALTTALAASWPQLGQTAIDIAHHSPPGLGKQLLHAWKQLPPVQQHILIPQLALPDYSVCLLDLAVAIERSRLHLAGSEAAQRAGVLNNLATRLSELGDAESRREALTSAREAVTLYRQLAQSQPAAYLPYLAMSLNNLANRLSAQGDAEARREALTCAREALALYRQLAQSTAYLPYLALSLNTLANRLSEQGDAAARREALTCARESVTIRRQLAQSQPAAYLPYLPGSLNTLATFLSAQGDAESRREALTYAREAVTIRRQLAQSQPAAYLPDLAASLNNLATFLSAQGDAESRREALTCAREAVTLYRQLAQSQPAAYLAYLAGSLNTLAIRLSEQGDAQALVCAREAVTLYRQLAQSQHTAYLPDLAMVLNTLANRLSEQGCAESRREALTCAREAVTIRRQLAQSQPAAYLPDLAMSLNNLAIRLSEQGGAETLTEALNTAKEAFHHFVILHASMPAAFERHQGISGSTLRKIAEAAGLNGEETVNEVLSAVQAQLNSPQGE